MRSPWEETDKAFEPMHTETVVFVCKRKGDADMRQAVDVAVFADGTGDVLSEGQMDTDRQDILVSCKRKDWSYVRSIRRGDIIKRVNFGFRQYAVQSVDEDDVMGFVIRARSF